MMKLLIIELMFNNKKNKVVIYLSFLMKLGYYWVFCLILFVFFCVFLDCFGELMEDLMVLLSKVIVMVNVVIVDLLGIDFIYFNFVGLM